MLAHTVHEYFCSPRICSFPAVDLKVDCTNGSLDDFMLFIDPNGGKTCNDIRRKDWIKNILKT